MREAQLAIHCVFFINWWSTIKENEYPSTIPMRVLMPDMNALCSWSATLVRVLQALIMQVCVCGLRFFLFLFFFLFFFATKLCSRSTLFYTFDFIIMLPTPDLSHLKKQDYEYVYDPAGTFLFFIHSYRLCSFCSSIGSSWTNAFVIFVEDTFLFLDAFEDEVPFLKELQPTISLEVG